MSLLSWLLCLNTDANRPMAVICEYLEDLVVCTPAHTIFVQLKTRDRGSWSDKSVCEDKGAAHSICRTFSALSATPSSIPIRFEIRLEGAAASTKSTAQFFKDPTSADDATRKKLAGFGVKRGSVSKLLAGLSIHPNQPPRGHIDAVILQTIGSTWPSMSDPERIALSLSLLTHVELAQEGRRWPLHPFNPVLDDLLDGISGGQRELVDQRILTAEDLTALTPPLPATPSDELRARASRGEASALELKLRAAGASPRVVSKALELRAESEMRRQEVLSLDGGDAALDKLDDALLMLAHAAADQAALLGGNNPSIAARPADYVFNNLLTTPQTLLAVDAKQVFEGRFDSVMGYLCHLSDSCRFAWRPPS